MSERRRNHWALIILKAVGNSHWVFSVFTVLIILVYFIHCPIAFTVAWKQTPEGPVEMLNELKVEIEALPAEAFIQQSTSAEHRMTLSNKVDAVINQVESGALNGAIQKLQNDLKSAIENWILQPWRTTLISKINAIVDLLENYM